MVYGKLMLPFILQLLLLQYISVMCTLLSLPYIYNIHYLVLNNLWCFNGPIHVAICICFVLSFKLVVFVIDKPLLPQVCKLLRHVAATDTLQVAAKYSEINLRIYGPQVVTSAQTLCLYPTSKIAKENVEGKKFFRSRIHFALFIATCLNLT